MLVSLYSTIKTMHGPINIRCLMCSEISRIWTKDSERKLRLTI